MTKEISYNEALTEIENILNELNSSAIDVDTLVSKVERANELVAICKSRLNKASVEIEKIISNDEVQ